MRTWLAPLRSSIASRLFALALLPTALMLVAGNASMYWLAVRDARTETEEHGKAIAAALAEGSRYAVISGSRESIEPTIHGLMVADRTLVGVEVQDASGRTIVALGPRQSESQSFVLETSIAPEPLNVDTFDLSDFKREGLPRTEKPIGIVRVHMSSEPIVQASIARLAAGSALVLLATIVSLTLALMLARRLREPLDDVMRALRDLRERSFDVRMRPGATGELAELQAAVLDMADGLRITHERLAAEVSARTAELDAAMRRLQAADLEKSRLIARANELVEEERRRISVEIHDDLNAVLVSVRMQAEALASAAAEVGQQDLVAAARRIAELVDATYARARAIVRKLRPEIIDALGLAGAVEETVRHFREIDRQCRFELSLQALPRVPEATAIAAYRMLQEALSNVVKHAGASRCKVTLTPSRACDAVTLIIEDDGRGFDSAAGGPGLGLVGIRERVNALSGTLNIESTPGAGTRISITLPITGT